MKFSLVKIAGFFSGFQRSTNVRAKLERLRNAGTARTRDRLFYNPRNENEFPLPRPGVGPTFRAERNLGRAATDAREKQKAASQRARVQRCNTQRLFVTRWRTRVCHGRREPDGYRWSLDAQTQLDE